VNRAESHSDQHLQETCREVVESEGFDLIVARWTTDQGRRILRLYVDRATPEEPAVTVEDCARISRRLGPVLDVEDAIAGAYDLEVSTPGLDRPLVRDKDFQRFVGQVAKVRLSSPLPSGRKRLKGTIRGVEDRRIRLEVDGEELWFPLDDVARANLVYQGDL
jgi:ribosome maturation factor RimP